MGTRVLKEVLYLRHEYTNDERLQMGSDLGAAYNRMQAVQDEEKVMKGQIKERMSLVEATIGTLSRNLNNGYTMENVDCDLVYDAPNVGEVSYKRRDNGGIVKTRAMTGAENQQEIEFHEAQAEVETAPAAESVVNIENFFGNGSTDAMKAEEIIATVTDAMDEAEEEDEDEQEEDEDEQMTDQEDALAMFANPDPAASAEAIKPEHDAAWGETPATETKRGRGRPKGSTKKEAELTETF